MKERFLERGQLVIVRPNTVPEYEALGHKVLSLGDIKLTKKGIIAKDCIYLDSNYDIKKISIPLILLWRIATNENLLELQQQILFNKS